MEVSGGASASQTDITAAVVDLNKNPPPDPTAYDRNDSFSAVSAPSNPQRTSASWTVWRAKWIPNWVWVSDWQWVSDLEWIKEDDGGGHWEDQGYWHDYGQWEDQGYWHDYGQWEDHGWWEFYTDSYSVSMSASIKISCDEKNPTSIGKTMKSGYGINEVVTSSVSGNGEHTSLQNAVAYFPEFYYQTYWRLLENTSGGTLEYRKNKYSTYNNRTHFTPVWFPDGNYEVYTWAMDCWTPAGMLSANLTDSVAISGNVFDDWHVAPTY